MPSLRGIQAGKAYVELSAHDGQLRAALVRARSRLAAWGRGLRGTLRGMLGFGGLLSASGLVAAGSAAVAAAKRQLDAEKKLAAVLNATGGAAGLSAKEIKAYAAQLQRLSNYSDETTISAAALLATFTKIKGGVFKEALSLAQDMSTVLGQDLKQTIIQLGKALNDPVLGASALRRVGVSLSAQQSDQIKKYMAQNDLLSAQRVILDELKNEFGGAARAMADPMVQLKNALGDLAEKIGYKLLPYVSLLSEQMTLWLEQTMGQADDTPGVLDKLVDGIEVLTHAFMYLWDESLKPLMMLAQLINALVKPLQKVGLVSETVAESIQGITDQITEQATKSKDELWWFKQWLTGENRTWSEKAREWRYRLRRQLEQLKRRQQNLAGAAAGGTPGGPAVAAGLTEGPRAMLAGSAELARATARQQLDGLLAEAQQQTNLLSRLDMRLVDIQELIEQHGSYQNIPWATVEDLGLQ